MSDDKYIELERAFIEQGRNFAKALDRVAELEANNARLREAAVEACGWKDSAYADVGALLDIRALEKALTETPADSLAAVRREAMEKMREKILAQLDAHGFIKAGEPALRLCITGVEADD